MPDDWSAFLSADAKNFRPSAIRQFAKLINDPSIISFAGGSPSPANFPAEALLSCAETVLITRREVALQYGPTPGLPRLREAIAAICRTRKIDASFEQVLVTTGSQQALHLVAEAILDPGDVVLVELPTYIGASSAFFARRAEQVGVAQDEGGIVLDDLRQVVERLRGEHRRIKCLYTIPNFQNPSGRLMEQARRTELLEIARREGFLILEDDPYGALRYDESADTTPIKASDSSEQVIYLGSFSKVLAPGLRCGWILAPAGILRSFELAKESADLCSGMLDQSLVDEFCSRGQYEPQVSSVRDFYRARRDILMESLTAHFSNLGQWTAAAGGLFTFLTLNADLDTAEWVPRAIERGVAYVPGGPFFVDGSGRNSMRLTFAKETDARMREGITRLADLFKLQEH